MTRFADKNALGFGIANDHSIAYAIATALAAEGAQLGLSYGDERLARRVEPLAATLNARFCVRADVGREEDLEMVFATAAEAFGGRIDVLVHSLAYADRDDLLGPFVETRREGFGRALDISAYSLISLTRRALPFMVEGSSVLTLSYYGAEKVVPGYKVMGPAKAALESVMRYLAVDVGAKGVRVNAISAGPIRTLAAAGIPGFRDMQKAATERAPLGRTITTADVARSAVFLLSDDAAAITGEVLHVDAGYHLLGQ